MITPKEPGIPEIFGSWFFIIVSITLIVILVNIFSLSL